MTDVDMGRISVMLPTETIRQIDDWAAAAGVKRGQFTSMALVVGARVLARQLNPEAFLTLDAWRGLAQALNVDSEKLQEALRQVQVKERP